MSFERLTDDHVPSSPEVFLDTSIHCCRHKGPLFRDRVSAVFRLFRWKSTSSYAKVEFGNVVLASAQYFLGKIGEFGSLERALDFIGNVLPHTLHSSKVTWSFNLLRHQYGADDAECTERARLSLRRLMKLGVALVEETCDRPIADGTACFVARRGVQKKRNGTLAWNAPNCTRNHRRCHVDEFFVANRQVFARIKEAIDALPDDDSKSAQLRSFSRMIAEAMEDPQVLLNYRNGCRLLADAIIAVDSRGYQNMFSQNAKESELLTAVLGQTFYYLPPNPDKGVLVARPSPTAPENHAEGQ